MEEIKLPKFKTKEELEQFAMGLMTENESLKTLIKYKDSSIAELGKNVEKNIYLDSIVINQRDEINRLESEVEHLREKISDNYYKGLYEKESDYHAETMKKGMDYQHKFEESKKMVHKLLSMVIFMYGLLYRVQAKRVVHAFGEFNAAEYRL